jgi:hypothetical protein
MCACVRRRFRYCYCIFLAPDEMARFHSLTTNLLPLQNTDREKPSAADLHQQTAISCKCLTSLAFFPRYFIYQAVQPKYSGPLTASLGSFANRRFHGWTGDGQKGGEARQQGREGEHQPPLGSSCYPEAATLFDLRCSLPLAELCGGSNGDVCVSLTRLGRDGFAFHTTCLLLHVI